MNTVLTTSRVLTMRPDTPAEIRKKLERVTASGVRMQRMIEQLLDLTRARLGGGIQVTLSPEPVPLRPVVTKIIDEIRAAHPGAAIEAPTNDRVGAHIDVDRFEQVVSNLLGNAVAHGDLTRPIRVDLRADSTTVWMTVHNYGTAIEPSTLPLLFNPFARSEKPSTAAPGLGLGLYISERIIDAHGGKLSLQSSADEGTTVEVALPRRS